MAHSQGKVYLDVADDFNDLLTDIGWTCEGLQIALVSGDLQTLKQIVAFTAVNSTVQSAILAGFRIAPDTANHTLLVYGVLEHFDGLRDELDKYQTTLQPHSATITLSRRNDLLLGEIPDIQSLELPPELAAYCYTPLDFTSLRLELENEIFRYSL